MFQQCETEKSCSRAVSVDSKERKIPDTTADDPTSTPRAEKRCHSDGMRKALDELVQSRSKQAAAHCDWENAACRVEQVTLHHSTTNNKLRKSEAIEKDLLAVLGANDRKQEICASHTRDCIAKREEGERDVRNIDLRIRRAKARARTFGATEKEASVASRSGGVGKVSEYQRRLIEAYLSRCIFILVSRMIRYVCIVCNTSAILQTLTIMGRSR